MTVFVRLEIVGYCGGLRLDAGGPSINRTVAGGPPFRTKRIFNLGCPTLLAFGWREGGSNVTAHLQSFRVA
jgi:hypothetical protein